MKKYLKLYWLFIKYSFMKITMYKQDFIVWSLVNVGWFVLTISFYQIIYLNVSEIAGWTKPQLFLLQGFYFLFDFFLWGALWVNMKEIPQKVNTGIMDIELIKPINIQFWLSFKYVNPENFNSIILGGLTIAYSLNTGGYRPSIDLIVLSVLAFIIALTYIYAGWFATMCLSFWHDRIKNLHHFFPGLRQFYKVPHPFYKGILRGIFTFVIPITLVTTVPVEFLLNRPQWLWFAILSAFALVTLKFSNWFFHIAVKHYSGASS